MSFQTPAASWPAAIATSTFPATVAATPTGSTQPAAAITLTRDTAVADLPSLSASINLLAQAAAGSGAGTPSDGDSGQLELPPLTPMPAPQKPPDVPTDDHGTSNVVFSDPDADGSLIH